MTHSSEGVRSSIRASADAISGLVLQASVIARIGQVLVAALRRGGKVLTAGNGGSAAEALHMSEELVGRFKGNRRSLPGISLVADPTALTCIGNDFGYDEIFRRQVEGLARKGDVLVLFSTSGRAKNLQNALEAARRKRVTTVCLLGRDGGPMAGCGDHELIVRSEETARVQEAHQVVMHVLLEAVEAAFPPPAKRATQRKAAAPRAAGPAGGARRVR